VGSPPTAVLSEQLAARLGGRRVLALVFTTFQLDLGFFELQVLPLFFEGVMGAAEALRRRQLEEELPSVPAGIAVYYDRHGLVPSGGPARLDVRRIPINHPTGGTFHPKNLFVLLEERTPDEEGRKAQALLVGCLSGNLTQSGWWTNLEVAHFVEIAEEEHTSLRDPLREYLQRIVRAADGESADKAQEERHAAAQAIRAFLRNTRQRTHLSVDGRLQPQFHGEGSLVDFLNDCAGASLRGMCLEVVSPYFDPGPESKPLVALIELFQPREVRVFLPRNRLGEAACSEELFRNVSRSRSSKNGPLLSWAKLPRNAHFAGKTQHRRVHAKVYRFFEPKRGGRELLYVGSANLTVPGFQLKGGGNWESGFFVETTGGARPDWWLTIDRELPTRFVENLEDEDAATSGGSLLQVRYHWNRHLGELFWGGRSPSARLTLALRGLPVLELAPVAPRTWTPLPAQPSSALRDVLASSSLLEVVGEAKEPTFLLVQEEGMEARPSTDHQMTPGEILYYWSLLTPAQRAAFHESRLSAGSGEDPAFRRSGSSHEATLFDRFAGHFHAFQCLERQVRESLLSGSRRVADYRLFGTKHDSLGAFLERIADAPAEDADPVSLYVLALCARQLRDELRHDFPVYWRDHAEEVVRLDEKLKRTERQRTALTTKDPELSAFLAWLEPRFLRRARALPEEVAP
jgi:hypothetical protein